MKLKSLILVAGLVAFGSAEAQAPAPAQGSQREGRAQVNQSVVQACKAEMKQLCQGQSGKQAEQCLRSNSEKLSSQCKDAVSKSPQN